MSTKWTTNKLKKNNVEKVGPKKLKKNNVEQAGSYNVIYLHIHPDTVIYPQITLYTYIYLHIHEHIEYWENDGQHKTQQWS